MKAFAPGKIWDEWEALINNVIRIGSVNKFYGALYMSKKTLFGVDYTDKNGSR